MSRPIPRFGGIGGCREDAPALDGTGSCACRKLQTRPLRWVDPVKLFPHGNALIKLVEIVSRGLLLHTKIMILFPYNADHTANTSNTQTSCYTHASRKFAT